MRTGIELFIVQFISVCLPTFAVQLSGEGHVGGHFRDTEII